MPSVNTGKNTIKSIKVYKDHITISFAKREKLEITKEAYLSVYLYKGKSLSKKEIDKLVEISAISKLLNYGLSLISKRHYSEKKMYEKLKAKETNKAAIIAVINKLKESDLLDDKAYMEDLIAWDNERKFGQKKIIEHLRKEGIPDSLIQKAHFSHSNELKKAKALIPKLDKKYSRYGYENKKNHIYQALLAQGYDYDVAREALNDVKKDKPKLEAAKVLNDLKKLKRRYSLKYEGYQLRQKIYAALVSKGYKHSEIKEAMEKYCDENDF